MYLVAYGENQRSTYEVEVKSFKSIQIKQIYFERFEKILSDFCHEVTLIICDIAYFRKLSK